MQRDSAKGGRQVRLNDNRVELVTVFRSGNLSDVEIAESILRSAEMPYMTTGKGAQELFGVGRLPGGMNFGIGAIEIQVRSEDAADARSMLEELQSS